jgi:two-component system, OmpR family, response regulator
MSPNTTITRGHGPMRKARPVRILCIDDNRELTDSYHLMLLLHGYEVESCYNGPDAIRKAIELKPDFCLIDLHMPGMAGDEVARKILAACPDQPPILIAITAMSGDLYKVMTSLAGFRRHLVKPVDPANLIEIMAEEISRRNDR